MFRKLARLLLGDSLFTREWSTTTRDYWVPALISGLICIVWVVLNVRGTMTFWAISWPVLEQGAYATLLLHMVAHGGLVHLVLNCAVLLLVGGPLHSRLGAPPIAGLRLLYIFVGSGISGALAFLALNAGATQSMLGASGAIFGLVAALARVHPVTGDSTPIVSSRTWQLAGFFTLNHAALFVLLGLLAFFWGKVAIVAWEAHLGGAIFGFLLAPLFLPEADEVQGTSEST